MQYSKYQKLNLFLLIQSHAVLKLTLKHSNAEQVSPLPFAFSSPDFYCESHSSVNSNLTKGNCKYTLTKGFTQHCTSFVYHWIFSSWKVNFYSYLIGSPLLLHTKHHIYFQLRVTDYGRKGSTRALCLPFILINNEVNWFTGSGKRVKRKLRINKQTNKNGWEV